MRRLAITLALLTFPLSKPLSAESCDNHFFVGTNHYETFLAERRYASSVIFAGQDEVTGIELYDRLAARSPSSDACEEWAILVRRMGESFISADDAVHHFTQATRVCSASNAARARDNIATVTAARDRFLGTYGFVQQLEVLCRE